MLFSNFDFCTIYDAGKLSSVLADGRCNRQLGKRYRGGFMPKLGLICILLLTASVWAEEPPIGYVKNVTGEASVTNGGKVIKAEVGSAVLKSSVLRTGPKSSMGVTFKDETVMSFGPDTELTVDEYLYAPAQGKLKFGSKLAKGSINYVSGVIAKLQPDAVSISTPSGIIGVRGTQFVVTVEE
jgi:hypothetical protein